MKELENSFTVYFEVESGKRKWVGEDGYKHESSTVTRYKFICVNNETIDYRKYDFDGFITFKYVAGRWEFTVISEEVDCLEIAKKYKGNGHKSYAKFTMNNKEFFKWLKY